ncbi:hypothetical protein HW115_12760 [Verrucomicrobiaceae bacterium N1E253]|uniref:Neuromedin U n=1 Tax=Oceaniferula marina TaxID=2748318 RepID=A0A851GGJ8_9BACT|nr:transporter [Oceaniferula marina]NWK56486.1 hypothetical protein [Oceaniferula marina]
MKALLPATTIVLLYPLTHASESELIPDITRPEVALQESTETLAEMSLADVDQKLNNPLTSLWSLTLQENYTILKGDNIDGTTQSNNLFFQPAFPLPLGEDMTFIARPVFPLVTSPILRSDGSTKSHTSGLGDIQMFALIGPDKSEGLTWGLGGTFIFPTANNDLLGSGKWQAGPAAMVLNLGEKWTTGFVLQHWWSFAGDNDRPSQNHTDFQYIMRRKLPGAMSIGMGPTVSIDWNADSGNQITLPIGLGITKTVRIGKLPVKLRFEPQYSLIKPDDVGSHWNFRLQITPVIPSPFKR